MLSKLLMLQAFQVNDGKIRKQALIAWEMATREIAIQ